MGQAFDRDDPGSGGDPIYDIGDDRPMTQTVAGRASPVVGATYVELDRMNVRSGHERCVDAGIEDCSRGSLPLHVASWRRAYGCHRSFDIGGIDGCSGLRTYKKVGRGGAKMLEACEALRRYLLGAFGNSGNLRERLHPRQPLHALGGRFISTQDILDRIIETEVHSDRFSNVAFGFDHARIFRQDHRTSGYRAIGHGLNFHLMVTLKCPPKVPLLTRGMPASAAAFTPNSIASSTGFVSIEAIFANRISVFSAITEPTSASAFFVARMK